MPKTIKVGGLNASKNEEKNETLTNKKKTTPKKAIKSTPKKKTTGPKTFKPNKGEVENPVAGEQINNDIPPVQMKESRGIENVVDVGEDGRQRIDLSNLGEGMFAEIEPEEVKRVEKENKIANLHLDIPNDTPTEVPQEVPSNYTLPAGLTNNPSTNTEEEIDPVILAAGNPKCYAFLSLKATGVYKPDIISLSLITEDGKSFYAEFKDVDMMKINPSVLQNVIHKKFNLKNDEVTESRMAVTGDNDYIRSKLLEWIRENYTNQGHIMQVVSDRVVNEFGLFLEFVSDGIPLETLSSMVSPVCIDINTLIAGIIDVKPNGMNKEEFLKNYIPVYIATELSRIGILEDDKIPEEYMGNALVAAQVTRRVFRKLYEFDKDENKEPDTE